MEFPKSKHLLIQCGFFEKIGVEIRGLAEHATENFSGIGNGNSTDEACLNLWLEATTHAGLHKTKRQPYGIVIPAGGGKTTLIKNNPKIAIDVDDIVTEHTLNRYYQSELAWTLANMVARIRIHIWFCKERKLQSEDWQPIILCHSPQQLPPYFKWKALSPVEDLHETNIIRRSERHQAISRMNWTFVQSLVPIIYYEMQELKQLVMSRTDYVWAPYLLMPTNELSIGRAGSMEVGNLAAILPNVEAGSIIVCGDYSQVKIIKKKEHSTMVVNVVEFRFWATDSRVRDYGKGCMVAVKQEGEWSIKLSNYADINNYLGIAAMERQQMIIGRTYIKVVEERLSNIGHQFFGFNGKIVISSQVGMLLTGSKYQGKQYEGKCSHRLMYKEAGKIRFGNSLRGLAGTGEYESVLCVETASNTAPVLKLIAIGFVSPIEFDALASEPGFCGLIP